MTGPTLISLEVGQRVMALPAGRMQQNIGLDSFRLLSLEDRVDTYLKPSIYFSFLLSLELFRSTISNGDVNLSCSANCANVLEVQPPLPDSFSYYKNTTF